MQDLYHQPYDYTDLVLRVVGLRCQAVWVSGLTVLKPSGCRSCGRGFGLLQAHVGLCCSLGCSDVVFGEFKLTRRGARKGTVITGGQPSFRYTGRSGT